MVKHPRVKYGISAVVTTIPYFVAFFLNQSFIADLFSLTLFAITIYHLRIPVLILRTGFKIKNTEHVLDGLKNPRWLGWWLSPSIFGTTTYLYFILVKNNVLFSTSVEYPYLENVLIIVFWWIITLVSFTFLYQKCWKEYLTNVHHIGDDVIKREEISAVRWTRTQDFLVKEIGLRDFQTYERVTLSYSMALGMLAFLSVIFFLGGDVILDVLMLILVVYALLFNPTSPLGEFQEFFYKQVVSGVREAHRSSFMISILLLLALVGHDIVSLGSAQLIPFLAKVISLVFALSFFLMKRTLMKITKFLPYLACFWIFFTYFFSTQNLTSAVGFCLLPLAWYFLHAFFQVGVEDARRSTVSKMIVYVVLFAATSFASAILFFIETGSFLSIAFLVFAQYLVVSISGRIIKSRKVLVQTKFKEEILRRETRISIASFISLFILMIAYFYFFFLRDYGAIVENLYNVEMLPIIFLRLALTVFVLPFVLLGYFFLFPPYAKYILTPNDLLCNMWIVRARIPLNTVTNLEKETKLRRITHRVPFLMKPGTIINCCGPSAWSKKIKHDQIVIFASEDFNRHLQEVSRKSFKIRG